MKNIITIRMLFILLAAAVVVPIPAHEAVALKTISERDEERKAAVRERHEAYRENTKRSAVADEATVVELQKTNQLLMQMINQLKQNQTSLESTLKQMHQDNIRIQKALVEMQLQNPR